MEKEISIQINILRWMLVIGVVFIHLPFHSSPFYEYEEASFPIYSFLYRSIFLRDIALSGLFLISGFLYFIGHSQAGGGKIKYWYYNKIKRRIKSILIPYIIWNVIYLLFEHLKIRAGASDLVFHSISDYISCFYAVQQGPFPEMPVAPYTWFLRDLFLFAVLSPVYLIILYYRKVAIICLFISIYFLAIRKGWFFYNPALFIGSYLGYHLKNMFKLINSSKILVYIAIFTLLISNYIYYWCSMPWAYLLVFVSGYVALFFVAKFLVKNRLVNAISSSSTFLYLTHVMILGFTSKIILKVLCPQSDIIMICAYFLNLIGLLIIVYPLYFLLKSKYPSILGLLTGGRI